ncbi:calcium-binding protein [Pseudophaeobacter profundi]|uniref:calcium-binding protein n=1 Tax=Pseudophaeobacter profundi TaxID=3034152 RepID=UPI0024317154|nr:type I secretion protein [Pseudophaeobacter profundi]
MLWMALLGVGLIAGVAFIIDDDDDDNISSDTDGGSDTSGGGDTGGGDTGGGDDTGGTDTGGGDSIDPFTGASGDDEIVGDETDNTILGKNGTDNLDGGDGDDRVFGDGGHDTVQGGAGDDSVFGGHGNDLVMGGEDDDQSRGGRDDDVLIDATGTDTLHGDGGNDVIVASGTMDATAEAEFLANPEPDNGIANLLDQLQIDFSDDSDTEGDHVFGGSGDDTVIFGVNDTVTGGSGADTLLTASWLEGGDAATVTDFTPDEDRLIYAYDPADGEPDLSMEMVENDDGTSDAVISANGAVVIRVEDQDDSFDLAEHLLLVNGVRSG